MFQFIEYAYIKLWVGSVSMTKMQKKENFSKENGEMNQTPIYQL